MIKRILILLLVANVCCGAESYLGAISDLTWTGSGTEFYSSFGEYWSDTNDYKGLWLFETTNATQTLDSSGLAHHGSNYPSVASGPTWSISGTNQNGEIKHSYIFDGGDDAFAVEDSDDFDLNRDSFSVGAWVKNLGGSLGTIMAHVSVSADHDGFALNLGYSAATTNKIYFYDGDNYRYGYAYNATNWTHIVVTGPSTGFLYVNGVQVASSGYSPAMNGNNILTIGCTKYPGYMYQFLNAEIEAPFVLKYNLSSNEVYEMYQNTHPTNDIRELE